MTTGEDFSAGMAARAIHPGAVPVCAGCSCLCHDLDLLAAEPDFRGCELGERFAALSVLSAAASDFDVSARVDLAVKRLRDALHFGRSIAFVGLENLAWEAQKQALSLAEAVGAWVVRESEFRGNRSPWAAAFAQKGGTNATWGEIRLRSDAIVLWYAPLWRTHPRWIERFGPVSQGARRLAVVTPDMGAPPDGWIEDQIIALDPARANDFLRSVRAGLADESLEPEDSGVRRFVHAVRNSRWLAIVRGDDPPALGDAFGTAETWTDLVAEANSAERRVVSTHVPTEIGAVGSETLLSIRAGISTPMRFAAEGPVRADGEWSAESTDFVVSFMTGLTETEIPAGIRFVPATGWVVDGASGDAGMVMSIPVGTCGRESAGTMIRGDGIVVPVRSLQESAVPDLAAILRIIRDELRNVDGSKLAPSRELDIGAEADR